jgi:hypothetical protein
MRQGWKSAALAALACAVLATAALPARDAATAAAKKPSASAAKRAKNALRQFTGYVVAMEKKSITVEKRGKTPQTKVFVRDENTASVGDVAKDAHVTVHYRDEGGQLFARRVVVKPLKSDSDSERR